MVHITTIRIVPIAEVIIQNSYYWSPKVDTISDQQ